MSCPVCGPASPRVICVHNYPGKPLASSPSATDTPSVDPIASAGASTEPVRDASQGSGGEAAARFERRVEISPAFDRRHPDPRKNYGIGAAMIRFTLIGPAGATYFACSTGWYLPSAVRHLRNCDGADSLYKVSGFGIGYHSPFPMYDGQQPAKTACEYLGGRPCYSDCSFLASDPIAEALVAEGDVAVWRALEEWYDERFGRKTDAPAAPNRPAYSVASPARLDGDASGRGR